MPLKLQFLLLSLLAQVSLAGDSLMEGGRSPNGRCEVRIERENTDNGTNDAYGVHLHLSKTAERIFTLPETGGYLRYPAAIERDRAYWHASSKFVAITDQGSRHSRELYIVDLSNNEVTLLEQPDFYQNALGRVGAVHIDFASMVTPKKWEGDDLILNLHFTANQRRAYTFEVVLSLSHAEHTKAYLSLKSVKKLKEEEG